VSNGEHCFGGDWTEEKLDRVDSYLKAYRTVMKNQPFRLLYIDAFAGSGQRSEGMGSEETGCLFELEGQQRFREGSARRALKLELPFHKYIFVERDASRASSLESLRGLFPLLADRIEIINDDSNDLLQTLCQAKWRDDRAVLFLDPYGMQVEWNTMEAISRTEAIDAWILFPLSGVNRNLPRSGEHPPAFERALDRFFGCRDWRNAFYAHAPQADLFGVETSRRVADIDAIEQFYISRLKTVFPGVARNPLRLSNSRKSPLFSLCFVCSNPSPKAYKKAISIAEYILRPKNQR